MKNIFVLPTDKPSRLIIYSTLLNEFRLLGAPIEDWKHKRHLYITSTTEEVKAEEWFLDRAGELWQADKEILKVDKKIRDKYYKKIILTTDQDLIKDGVQAIDNKFLEWFVKNPSCEFVQTEKYHGIKTSIAEISAVSGDDEYNWRGVGDNRDYKIIIPKEELKKEESEIIDLRLPDMSGLSIEVKDKVIGGFLTESGKYLIAYMELFGLKTHIECTIIDDKNKKSFVFIFREENYHKEQQSENRFSEKDMLKASEYGYNFHKTTQFPEQNFEDSCIRNTQQWLTTFKNQKK